MKKEVVAPGERTPLRDVLGRVDRLQREPSHDQAGNAPIGMSRILQSTVQDFCDADASVTHVNADPYLGVIIPSIPSSQLKWATIQGASFGNAKENKSQAGSLVGATTQALWKNPPVPFAVLSYRSNNH